MRIGHGLVYEIGYLYNDYYTTKKEKNPTIRITEIITNKFVIGEILLRIVLITLVGVIIYFYVPQYFVVFIGLIGFTGIVYYIHNSLRNEIVNYFTRLLLRISKILVVVPLLYTI